MHADRVAQALAPDAVSWLREAIPATFAAGAGSTASMTTASGGEVVVRFVDEPIIEDWIGVWFRPAPPPTRALEPSGGDVVYTESYERGGEVSQSIWVVNADGTDAMRLRAGKGPAEGVSDVLGWSADGSRLFYQSGDSVEWIDASGSEPVQVAGGLEQVTLSRDGTKLAYPIGDRGLNSIGILDIATGQVTKVRFAMDTRPGERPCEGPFGGGEPQWSPDGTRFVFGISVGPKVDRFCRAAIYTVASDGTGLRRLNPANVNAMEPRWTPDGSILFDSPRPHPAPNATGDLTAVPVERDIYSVRPDGSGLTALTSDGVSTLVTSWTRDGRIVFNRHAGPDSPGELWIMDADGSNAAPLGNTLAAQTAAGCVVCPYVNESQQISFRYWQPMPGDRP
jgi:dipeptidyl aminopeptidase/acylaminoacyl peptidase